MSFLRTPNWTRLKFFCGGRFLRLRYPLIGLIPNNSRNLQLDFLLRAKLWLSVQFFAPSFSRKNPSFRRIFAKQFSREPNTLLLSSPNKFLCKRWKDRAE